MYYSTMRYQLIHYQLSNFKIIKKEVKMVKLNKKLSMMFMVFLVFFCISTLISAVSAADTGNNTTNATGIANSTWSKFQGDLNNTGQSNTTGPQTNNVEWTYTCPGTNAAMTQNTNVAVDKDGTIYLGVKGYNYLYALNSDGSFKWQAATSRPVFGIAIGSDGIIYAATASGSAGHNVYAFYSNGTQKWVSSTISSNLRGITIFNGTIYVGCDDGNIYALYPDNGTVEWSCTTNASTIMTGTPAVGADGTIYIGNNNGYLFAINPNGTVKWSISLGGQIQSGPSIGSDGTIYVGSTGGYLYAITDSGTYASQLWNYSTGSIGYSTPAISSADGSIYVGNNNGIVYALAKNGTLEWTYTTGAAIYSSPVIGADGTIYIGSNDGYIYALTSNGTLKWKYSIAFSVYDIAMTNGTLYVANGGTKLYAFQDLAPVASFTVDNTTGTGSLTAHFTDTSTNNPTSWSWDFGDGTTSADKNPTHTYSTPGTYTVKLTATNSGGSSSTTQTNLITVNWPVPAAGFTANTTNCTTSASIQFNDTSTGNITGWSWDFGDGTTSTDENPAHTYSTPGVYTVELTVSGPGGSNSTTSTDYITVNYPAPVAGFTANATSITVNGNVQFTDISTGNITGWSWSFGDGSTSTDENPTHTYSTPGVYTVELTVSGPGGSDSSTQTNLINVYAVPVASFTANSTNISVNGAVQFADNSAGNITGWSWDFGDGSTSTDKNPTHVYTTAGTYTVKLTVTGPGGADTNTKTSYITVIAPDTTAPTASASLLNGTYNTNKNVTLSMSENGTIYYTTNGSTPTTSSKVYTGAINITSTTTLKFIAVDLAGNNSPVYTMNYTIDKAAPTASASVKSGTYTTVKTVTLKMSESGTIYYTTNGSTPTTSSKVYTNPVNITSTTTLKFFAVDTAGNPSPVYTVKYTIDKTAPKVSAICPTSSAAGVLRTKTVSIRLSESILKGVNWSKVYIKNLKSGQKCKATIWISGNHIYISTNSKKAALTWYQVYIPAAAIKDSAGNNLAAAYTFKFKTGKS
jgi:FOG: PKD repeat